VVSLFLALPSRVIYLFHQYIFNDIHMVYHTHLLVSGISLSGLTVISDPLCVGLFLKTNHQLVVIIPATMKNTFFRAPCNSPTIRRNVFPPCSRSKTKPRKKISRSRRKEDGFACRNVPFKGHSLTLPLAHIIYF
jgi:hypothetical protein